MHKKKKEPGRRKGPGPSDAEEPPSDAALSPEPPGDEEPRAEDLAEIEQEEQAGPDEPADDLPAGDSARMYLKEIGRIPRLDRDGEARLARKIRSGELARELLGGLPADPDPVSLETLEKLARAGERAKGQMAEANLRLVVSVARRYVNRGMPFQDLIQEGNLGLLKAVEKFDPANEDSGSIAAEFEAPSRGPALPSFLPSPSDTIPRLSPGPLRRVRDAFLLRAAAGPNGGGQGGNVLRD